MHQRRAIFPGTTLPLALLAPQLAVTLVFFMWPAGQALFTSLYTEDAFGFSRQFVGLANFARLFADPAYLNSFTVTLVFSGAVTFIGLGLSLMLAFMADRVLRGRGAYRTLLILPYAVAPAVAGVLWWFLFNPSIGILPYLIRQAGFSWNPFLDGNHAMILIVVAAVWKQISYNFLFFLAGLQAIPRSLVEAGAIDGAGPMRRFRDIVFPLLAPTTFFLLVVNVVYAFFDTFGIVHATTSGGPGQSTTILVYKVYADGFVGLDLGGSAAQSVVLMAFVAVLTVAQFRYIERRVTY